ncbi:MAG: DNA topoisomerase III [bacterium]|nr:DNA topoisomerase III [bacterium]
MTIAVLAEKPSVAREIAQVLGARKRSPGALEGNGYRVTWAVGHLASLAQPHEIDARWKRWELASLPLLPAQWPLSVYEKTRDQFEIVKRILCDPETSEIVCATDAGREGELIFRFIYEAAGATKPVQRLWISSLTPSAIRNGFDTLRPAGDFDGLADAARGRSRADWLVGINLSRVYTLRQSGSREVLSVGRVQTPTLAMVVERELAIRDFVAEPYREVHASFREASDPDAAAYTGVWFDPRARKGQAADNATRLPPDGERAEEIARRASEGAARVASRSGKQRKLPPPRLYDLTELQRHANRLYGTSAKNTLDLAQGLYEKKLLSYPRTDSRALSSDVAGTLPEIVAAIRAPYADKLAPGTGERPLGSRFVNDSEVGDHHALIPTPTAVSTRELGRDEARIYDLVCRRLLAAWHEDHLYSTTHVVTQIAQGEPAANGEHVIDAYRSTGTQVDREGWRVLDPPRPRERTPRGDDPELPASLREGLEVAVIEAQVLDKATRPPRRFTEATLLTAMETAGKTLDDRELSEAMRGCGLGTPATRAGIIETLLARELFAREGKSLLATDKGIHLISLVHPEAKSPAMTGLWESRLRKIQHGEERLDHFMAEIERFVVDVVGQVEPAAAATRTRAIPSRAPREIAGTATPDPAAPPPSRPTRTTRTHRATPPSGLEALLRERFGHAQFREHQAETCRALTQGEDTLLVMPTGAGKSLCYQLPGIARAGTTLVVSPLIALMEDQVAALQARGFAAERIHSGRTREQSREVCLAYRDAQLDFLFIAPERLSVPGFPELLARTPPCLIAIDEAHCISQWGHDFRPDYRMLKERLPALRPAPIVALTATATERVQRDILEQLGIPAARLTIQGFRRENIAIEVVEMKPSLRGDIAARLLAPSDRRPAIVYAPTRKKAEALAEELGEAFPTAPYHAGMESERRDAVQAAFLRGALDVVVATVAFGMGIDKPDIRTVIHLALPASVEGYYQEIGRSGRDGKPARAFLLHSAADKRTHEWFFARDYPAAEDLERLHQALEDKPRTYPTLRKRAKLAADVFERALEKLRTHGGALLEGDDRASRGSADWRPGYQAQLTHRRAQLRDIMRFAAAHDCRMLRLVNHFGDQADDGRSCGQCDACSPETAVCRELDSATPAQRSAMERILKSLASEAAPSSGRLHQTLFGPDFPRGHFEALLAALHRAGLIHIEEDGFESDGEWIDYKRPVITASGRRANPVELEAVKIPLSASGPEPRTRRRGRRKKAASRKTAKKARRRRTRKPKAR